MISFMVAISVKMLKNKPRSFTGRIRRTSNYNVQHSWL